MRSRLLVQRPAGGLELGASRRVETAGDPELLAGHALAGSGDGTAADAADPFTQLSAREIQVLRLVALGRTNREIGKLLGVSSNTVAVHRTNLMATLGVHKAAELVLIAVRKGLVNVQ